MNSAAWQPLRGAPEPGFAPVARRRRQELTPVRLGEHLLDLNNIRLIESEDFR
jgi:hypothetical protein